MDLPTADVAPSPRASRRSLFGLAGAAGVVGAAAALLSEGPVAASPDTDEPANLPTDGDIALLAQALGVELALRDLYRARLEVGAGDFTDEVSVIAENHEAYAQAIAGATGLSADGRNDDIYAANVEAFQSGPNTFGGAAHMLEQTAVSTHTALLGEYESADAIALTASIIVVEARHATIIADRLGVDLATKLGNEQPALELGGAA